MMKMLKNKKFCKYAVVAFLCLSGLLSTTPTSLAQQFGSTSNTTVSDRTNFFQKLAGKEKTVTKTERTGQWTNEDGSSFQGESSSREKKTTKKDGSSETKSKTEQTGTVKNNDGTSFEGKIKTDTKTTTDKDGKTTSQSKTVADGTTTYINEKGEETKIKTIQTTETTIDANGNVITTTKIVAKEGASAGCETLPSRLARMKTCLLCPMFEVILSTDQAMATKSFSALAPSFRNVILVVLALFIAYKTLMSVSALTKQDVGKYLGEILIQSFKVLLAFLLLSNSYYIYHYIINPLLKAAIDFGLVIIDNTVLESFNSYMKSYISSMPSGDISKELLASVMGAVKMFSLSSAELPTIGGSLICISTHQAANLLPDISMLIEGILCYGFGWAISLACCFYLLDSVVRFGIFCTLLPFLIASWPFKVTFNYTKQGWEIFMNTIFNFIMMGLVISLTSQLIIQAMVGDSKTTDVELAKKEGFEQIADAINGDKVDALKELMALDGMKFLVLLACCIFAFKLVEQINDLASNISGTSGGEGIGGKIGGLAAQGVKRVADTAKKAAGTAVKIGAQATGLSGVTAGVQQKWQQKNDAFAKKIAGGGSGGGGSGGGSSGGGTGGGYADDTSSWD